MNIKHRIQEPFLDKSGSEKSSNKRNYLNKHDKNLTNIYVLGIEVGKHSRKVKRKIITGQK